MSFSTIVKNTGQFSFLFDKDASVPSLLSAPYPSQQNSQISITTPVLPTDVVQTSGKLFPIAKLFYHSLKCLQAIFKLMKHLRSPEYIHTLMKSSKEIIDAILVLQKYSSSIDRNRQVLWMLFGMSDVSYRIYHLVRDLPNDNEITLLWKMGELLFELIRGLLIGVTIVMEGLRNKKNKKGESCYGVTMGILFVLSDVHTVLERNKKGQGSWCVLLRSGQLIFDLVGELGPFWMKQNGKKVKIVSLLMSILCAVVLMKFDGKSTKKEGKLKE